MGFSFGPLFGGSPPPPPPPPREHPVYLYIFVGLFVAQNFWEAYLKLRTRLRLRSENGVPLNVRKVLGNEIDETEYAKSQSYSLAKNNFGIFAEHIYGVLTTIAELALQPYMWNGPALDLATYFGYGAEDELARVAALMLISTPWDWLTSVPLSAYRVFVLEEKFGFNKYTAKSFFYDKLTSWLVDTVLSLLTMAPLVIVLRNLGANAWIYAWAFITCFALFFNIIHPIWVAPLFNTFKPLPEGEVRTGIENLVKATGLRCDRLFEVDGSRQSSHSNAYVAGFLGTKRIVIYDTLITHLDGDVNQICAVVAHEIGHSKLHHNWMQLVIVTFTLFTTFFTYGLCRTLPNLVTDFGFDAPCTYLYLHCFFLLYNSAVSPLMGPLMNAFTRQLEFQADEYSVKLDYDIRVPLKSLDVKNLGNLDPDPLVSLCHHSHPTLIQRCAAVEASLAAKAKKGK